MSKDINQHSDCSTQLVTAWQNIKPGESVTQLTKRVSDKHWYRSALFQQIDAQRGKWQIAIEQGTSLFRVYPCLSENEQADVYQGIIIKLNKPGITIETLVNELGRETSSLLILEYATFGKGLDKIVSTGKRTADEL